MKLIFVYNAEAGWVNGALDSAHKLISPKTYRCSLCAVTHHTLGMRGRWKRFVEQLEMEIGFSHRAEAEARYPIMKGVAWPAVLHEGADGVEVWLSAEQLEQAESLPELEQLITRRLDAA